MMTGKHVAIYLAVILSIAFITTWGKRCDDALGECEYNAPIR